MKRDGALVSLWQEGMPEYAVQAQELPDKVFDVVIVGGGITGVTTGLLLQKGGKSCLIAEAYNLCFGTTGGTTAHLNTFLDTDYHTIEKDFGEDNAQLLYQATRQALDLVKAHVQEYNINCGYEEKDGYGYAQDDKQASYLEDIFKASQKAGAEVEYTDRIPVPIPFQKAVVYHRQAQIHPARYVYALAKAFTDAGGVIAEACRVTDVANEERLIIESTRGRIRAHQLIYATHLPPGINLLHFRCAPYRSYAMAVTLADGTYPDGLAYDMYDPYHYYRTQDVDGKKYLIVGGEDHKTGHNKNTEECFRHLESYVRKYYQIESIAYKWSSQYFEPSDGLAYIGLLPGHSERLYVATGYSGNGITYSHIAAITLSDLILKGDSTYKDLFNPHRIKPVAGFAAFVKENADVVAQFVGKRIGQDKLETVAELAPGEARVVKYEGESVAVYKDENGQLYAVNPVCKHAKCIVGWNNAERSWDCPCHGARYDIRGHVITGPARTNLEIVELSDIMEREGG
ncbi:MAG: FAD-dependent oxidoreductase [Flavisolibacter sp.]|nr:FAD-dependent oxidoreductase [Flavisolibacter sp.]